MAFPLIARLIAALIALAGLSGIAIQLATSTVFLGSFGAAVWGMARYYTNIGNVGVAIILTGIAIDHPIARRPFIVGGAAINAALIGIVYLVLLSGTIHPGESYVAIVLLHYVVPALVMLFWLFWAERGLAWRDPLLWAVPPLAYFVYVLLRAQYDGRYPYPFINVNLIGWSRTLIDAVVITLGFLVFGLALVAIDRLLTKAGARSS